MTIPALTLNAYTIAQLIVTLVDFYEMLIIVYILLSWFPIREGSLVHDIGMVLRSLCEPYLGLFRRFIPSMGGIDFSPVIAVLALNLVTRLVIGIIV